MSTSDEELILSVIARIYSDIESITRRANSLAWSGIPDFRSSRAAKIIKKAARNFPNDPFVVRAEDGSFLSDSPIALNPFTSLELADSIDSQSRYIQFAYFNGWMSLAICAHSDVFIYASRHMTDYVWFNIYSIIHENAKSFELFAKVRGLDCISVLPGEDTEEGRLVRQDLRETMNVPKGDPFHWYVSKDGAKQPYFAGKLQQTIVENFFTAISSPQESTPLVDIIGQGKCLICDSTSFCSCNLATRSPYFYPPLLELITCSTRGLGVRALHSISDGTLLGEYVGEVFPTSLPDNILERVCPTYALGMTPPRETGPVVAVIDSSEFGNWTRFINHSCRPSTAFFSDTVAGRLGMFVRAVRDMSIFEEITIDYGDNYFTSSCMTYCECGEECCRHPHPDARQGDGDSKELSEDGYSVEVGEDSREYTDGDATGDDTGEIDSGPACQDIGDDIEFGIKSLRILK